MKDTQLVLLVDNPTRDLEGMVLTALEAAYSGARSFLVPMYKQKEAIRRIKPDCVLLNYLRTNNVRTVEKYKQKGIKIAVLDTEGIAGANAQEFADFFYMCDRSSLVDRYMFWGSDQMDAVLSRSGEKPSKSVVTGAPRYDFLSEKYLSALQCVWSKPFILVNTNFPLANPKYSSGTASEHETLLRVGVTPEKAQRLINENLAAFKDVQESIFNLAREFPHVDFIIRPHPFESLVGYATLSECENVVVRHEGTAVNWIKHAVLMLHINCTTAIEAAIIGTPSISLNWINRPNIDRPFANSFSEPASSISQVIAMIKAKLDGGQAHFTHDAENDSRDRLVASFHLLDGSAAERVAHQLIDLAREEQSISQSTYSAYLSELLVRISDHPCIWFIKEKIRRYHVDKYFTKTDVLEIIRRVQSYDDRFMGVEVKQLVRGHSILADSLAIEVTKIGTMVR